MRYEVCSRNGFFSPGARWGYIPDDDRGVGPDWVKHAVWMSEHVPALAKQQAERIVEILNASLERYEKKFGVKK